jgi:hypothetical protein
MATNIDKLKLFQHFLTGKSIACRKKKMSKQWFSMREIAEDLCIPIKTVYLYRRLGLIEAHKFGKHYRVSAEAYEIFKFNALGDVLSMMERI